MRESMVSAKKKPKKGKHANRMHFEALDKGGMTSTTHYPQMGEDGQPMEYGSVQETAGHPSMAHAVKAFKANMGHAFGETGAPGTPAGGAPTQAGEEDESE